MVECGIIFYFKTWINRKTIGPFHGVQRRVNGDSGGENVLFCPQARRGAATGNFKIRGPRVGPDGAGRRGPAREQKKQKKVL